MTQGASESDVSAAGQILAYIAVDVADPPGAEVAHRESIEKHLSQFHPGRPVSWLQDRIERLWRTPLTQRPGGRELLKQLQRGDFVVTFGLNFAGSPQELRKIARDWPAQGVGLELACVAWDARNVSPGVTLQFVSWAFDVARRFRVSARECGKCPRKRRKATRRRKASPPSRPLRQKP